MPYVLVLILTATALTSVPGYYTHDTCVQAGEAFIQKSVYGDYRCIPAPDHARPPQ